MINKLLAMLLLVGLLLFALGCPQSEEAPVATGGGDSQTTSGSATAPPASGWTGNARDFTYATYDGSSKKLSALAGTPIVLNFWGTW